MIHDPEPVVRIDLAADGGQDIAEALAHAVDEHLPLVVTGYDGTPTAYTPA